MARGASAADVISIAQRMVARGDLDAAARVLGAAGAIVGGSGKAFVLRGIIALRQRRQRVALGLLQRAQLLDPSLAAAYVNAGIGFRRALRPRMALRDLSRALVLKPGDMGARGSLGLTLLDLDRPADALSGLRTVICSAPGAPEGYVNLARGLHLLGRFPEAETVSTRALTIDPSSAEARHGRAFTRLLTGDWPGGWRDQQARWDLDRRQTHRPRTDVPQWTGDALSNRHLVVIADEARGDLIQFARCLRAPTLAGARISLVARASMHRLLSSGLPDVRLLATSPQPGPDTVEVPLSMIPLRVGATADRIPGPVPYLFAEPERVERWRARIGSAGFTVGICWQGNPNYPGDRGRSPPLAALAPLAGLPGIRLISLQTHHGLDQLARLPSGMRVETLGDDYAAGADDFLDAAAVMSAVDLVVTSDTATAHLAGALGRPVWVLLRRIPDWRWLLDRPDSPWYPSMRLYRQARDGDWRDPVERAARDLQALAAGASAGP